MISEEQQLARAFVEDKALRKIVSNMNPDNTTIEHRCTGMGETASVFYIIALLLKIIEALCL